MTWWYENEEEGMKLYKNEDLCIECKNEFFSKPYDHRDPTPGQLGYCIKCDNCLIKEKEKKMEFDRSRIYSAVNADELRAGDKVIVADSLGFLRQQVEKGAYIEPLREVLDENYLQRFKTPSGARWGLAYLMERAENCTNCGSHEVCGYVQNVSKFACLNRCENWKPKTEQKAEKPDLISLGNGQYAEGEKHYRPFKDTDELIKVWCDKGGEWQKRELTMPLIWVRRKERGRRELILAFTHTEIRGDMFSTEYSQGGMDFLFENYTFLNGSPCGVEE